MNMNFRNAQYENLMDLVVGKEVSRQLGFNKFSVIAGYPPDLNGDSPGFPGFPLSNIDKSKPFIIEAEKEKFWSRMNEAYPGEEEIPKFCGRVCVDIFIGSETDKIFHIGQ